MEKYIGKKLDGRYEITELIGVGGMAEVYKGIDVIDNKPVAIKVLKKEFAENEEFLRRFRNESKAIAVLSHPNIVRIYDVGFSDKLQYIVMEYVDGITLKEYIEDEKVISWKETVHFVIQILRALQHAHDKGIVHRDIKPQNIMMFNDGTIKVMDFGIAKFASEEGKTATDQAIGSVHYISPEQASGSVTDAKSDIYSVGAMMYEMLTGRKPFDSDNPVAIAVMHMHDIPERPRAINPNIADGLEEIVLKAMEKAPEDRYRSTGEMIADIEKFKANPRIHFGYYLEEGADEDMDEYGGSDEMQDEEAIPARRNAYNGNDRRYQQNSPYGNVDDYYDDYDDDDEDEEEERSSLVVPILTAVIVVVIIVGVSVVSLMFGDLLKDTSQKNDWKMPEVIGMDFNDAVNMYGNNIQFQEDGQEFNEAEPGIIIEQDIAAGSEFKKGAVLKVKISKGMETEEVPDVTNKNAELARDMLQQLGFECELKDSSSTDVPKGYVIKTEPEAGEQAHKNSTIIIYVSLGEEAGQVKVEDWVGRTVDDAAMLADYKGLKVVTKDVASYEAEGTVVKQSLEPNSKVDKGTEIVLEYSNGKTPDGIVPFTIDFPAEANGRFVIAFMIQKDDGTAETQETSVFYCPEYAQYTQDIVGTGEDVKVSVILTNLTSSKKTTIGTYSFNFAEGTSTCLTGGDVNSAFEQAGAFPEPETDAPADEPQEPENPNNNEQPNETSEPTSAPQENPNQGGEEYQPGINGAYDDSGNWIWYLPGENGYWDGNGYWVWTIW